MTDIDRKEALRHAKALKQQATWAGGGIVQPTASTIRAAAEFLEKMAGKVDLRG